MRYYFTSNNLIGSKIIRWGLEDDCSHFAIGFWSDENYSLVLESKYNGGFHVRWLKDFKKANTIVHCLEYPMAGKDEGEAYRVVCNALHGSSYDYKGVLFWTLIAAAYKSGMIKKDEMDGFNNRWADRDSVYCVEVLKAQRPLLKKLGFNDEVFDRQNLRPHLAYRMLLETGKFREV